MRPDTHVRSDWRDSMLGAAVSGMALVLILAGFATWLHPDLFDSTLPVPAIMTPVIVYPSVTISLFLLLGPRTFQNHTRLTGYIGIASIFSGAFCLLVFVWSSRQFPALMSAMTLQMAAVPWTLPRSDRRALRLVSMVVRGGTTALIVFWFAASSLFAAHIKAASADMAGGRQYCLSAPAWHDIFGSSALPPGSDMFLLQRVISYPVDLYYGRHRLELTIFESSDRFETFHWSMRNWRFEQGGFLTSIEACKATLRGSPYL